MSETRRKLLKKLWIAPVLVTLFSADLTPAQASNNSSGQPPPETTKRKLYRLKQRHPFRQQWIG